MAEEYKLIRTDMDRREVILIRRRYGKLPEVFADPSMPIWKVDAHVRAIMIKGLVEVTPNGTPDYPGSDCG
ncbi:hypothetical protein [Saccharopolyspora phatthalungensis]|uniref:Uncharacterized protein n=1 Tax=Saccharopolyspora phatthalungensis TaxID=664693 RepID=A0A840Q5M8_9PSEU|nr:hypothetical protein [Saccharopolyspora phatthalungensis]MBB5155001.1 hypothetical protein [Saccharopolyspora phatthalungensis]